MRIVSLVPSATETVCAVGAGHRLVGCTRYCEEPRAQLAGVQRVGGTKNPSLEGVAALEPDLILVNGEENRRADIAWLGERFTVLETTPRSVVEAAQSVRRIGEAVGGDDGAQALILAIEVQLARAEVEAHALGPVRVFYPIWPKPWMAVNRDTYIHDVLAWAGAHNVTGDRPERYPEVAEDELAQLRPEVVLLPSEPWEFDEPQRRQLVEREAFGRDVPVVLVDGRDFCWHGARTAAGLGRALDVLAPFRPPTDGTTGGRTLGKKFRG